MAVVKVAEVIAGSQLDWDWDLDLNLDPGLVDYLLRQVTVRVDGMQV